MSSDGGCYFYQLLTSQAVGLRQHRLALVVEVLREHAELGAMRVGIDSHLLILAVGRKPNSNDYELPPPADFRPAFPQPER